MAKSVGRSGELCDRFQGALLGISLLPAALFPARSDTSDRYLELPLERSLLQQAINCSLAQTRSFVSAPNDWTVSLVRLRPSAFWLPAGVPILLRYHNSWQRRFDRLVLPRSQVKYSALDITGDWTGVIAQLLMLGDLLEAMSFDESRLASSSDWIDWLIDCSARYQIDPQICVRYEELLSAIRTNAMRPATGDATQRSFESGVRSFLAHLESYVLAIRGLSGYASNHTALVNAAFVTGLLSGALLGGSGLPTLWQMRPDMDDSRELATKLFSFWAGGLPPDYLPH